MFVYWGLIGFFLIVALYPRNNLDSKNSSKKLFAFFAFFILIMMAGLRSEEVGTDTTHYASFFRIVTRSTSWNSLTDSGYELGFVVLMKVISLFSSEASVMIFVTSTIVVCLYGRFIMKSSTDIYMSFALFVLFGFYTNSFNIMRQHIAIGICLNGLLFLNKPDLGKAKSIFLFVASVFLAGQFHTSAWVFLVALLSPFSKKFPIVILLEGLAALVLFLFKDEIAFAVSTWFGYEGYLVSYAQRASYLDFVVYAAIFALIFLFLSVMEKKKEVFHSIEMEFHMLCIAMVIMTITLSEYGLIVRMADYFKPVIIVILPRLFQEIKQKDKIIAICMVCVVGCLFYGWSLYVNNGEIVPYISVFN